MSWASSCEKPWPASTKGLRPAAAKAMWFTAINKIYSIRGTPHCWILSSIVATTTITTGAFATKACPDGALANC